jgi:hypothetical protein
MQAWGKSGLTFEPIADIIYRNIKILITARCKNKSNEGISKRKEAVFFVPTGKSENGNVIQSACGSE